ncbi:MAG: efflux RND transporter periplasmic adaptor subunit [Syntrophomonadaceae bacterium]
MEGNISSLQKKKTMVCLGLIGLTLVAAAAFYGYFSNRQRAVVAQRQSLTATGVVEATTVDLAFKVAGKIDKMMVDTGSTVTAGQEIALLESRELEARLLQAQGGVVSAQGLIDEVGSTVPLTSESVEAKVAQAQAAYDDSVQTYERYKNLHDAGAISDSSLDQVTNKMNAAKGQLDEALAARISVEVAGHKYVEAVGKKQTADGALQEVQVALGNTHMITPVGGVITEKYLDTGEMVNAGTPVYEISDIQHPYVKVFIDETKIGRVQLNQEVSIQVDAYPGRIFKGRVVWISDAGQFAVRKAINEQYSHDIRSFEVKINVPNDELALKAGMTATVQLI